MSNEIARPSSRPLGRCYDSQKQQREFAMAQSQDYGDQRVRSPDMTPTLKGLGLSTLGTSAAWRGATSLAFTAGAVDAIGLSAVQRYSAHMTGTTSLLAGAIVGLDARLMLLFGATIAAFVLGAGISGVLIGGAKSADSHRVGAQALLLEGALIAVATPILLAPHGGVLGVVTVLAPLAMAMGLQNRTGVYLAGGKARTTHVTGTVTDFGFYVGFLLRHGSADRVVYDKYRTTVFHLSLLFVGFLTGGIASRLIFARIGGFTPAVFAVTPLALALYIRSNKPRVEPKPENHGRTSASRNIS